MTNTTIHLAQAFTNDENPDIPASLYAHTKNSFGEAAVSLDFGTVGKGKFGVMVTPRSARKLAHYLLAFADTADGLPVKEGDPTVDAPPLTDADAPDAMAA